jgi:hypothetical protein
MDAHEALKGKLQSMIDNYCEHESSSPLMALVKECKNCNQALAHRRWELKQWD